MEYDFPPGSDVVGCILSGPNASERMEFELYLPVLKCLVAYRPRSIRGDQYVGLGGSILI